MDRPGRPALLISRHQVLLEQRLRKPTRRQRGEQDYIEAKGGIADVLRPALSRFGKALGASGAVVVPFEGEATGNLARVINPGGSEESTLQKLVKRRTPGLLVLDSSLQDFDQNRHRFLFISLRDSISEFGDVKVFEVEELLQELTQAAGAVGLFEKVEKYRNKKRPEPLDY